jgi:hypothetical protein
MSMDFINSEANIVSIFINNYNGFVLHECIQETIK